MHKKKLFFFLLIFLNLTFINKLFAIDPYSFVQETADRASEALNKRGLNIPLHPRLTDADVDKVIQKIKAFDL